MDKELLAFDIPELNHIYEATAVRAGYPSGQKIKETAALEIQKAWKTTKRAVKPAAIIRKTEFKNNTPVTVAAKDLVIESRNLSKLISAGRKPEDITAFTLTLGKEISELISSSQENSLLQGFFLDAIGSVLAEEYAKQIERHVEKISSDNNMQITGRFSPGYCDWKTDVGQDALFAFLSPETIGIKKNRYGMMYPEKSISGIIIAGEFFASPYPCIYCRKIHCEFRRFPCEDEGSEKSNSPG